MELNFEAEGRVVGARLKGLSPLLFEWIEVIKDYCQTSNGDNPWWYNERATLSTLAGAAWRLKNWGALEEYSTDKRGKIPGDGGERLTSHGRCDLYVYNSSSGYAIEAKQAWQGVSNRNEYVRYGKAFDDANNDARHLGSDEADYRVGLVFTVPYVSIASVTRGGCISDELIKERLNNFIEYVCGSDSEGPELDAAAWIFPGDLKSYVNKNAGCIFPGIVVSMRLWMRGL